MRLTRLVYTSNHGGTTDEAVENILERSRTNNDRDSITGVLIVSEEDFMQLLEGERTEVAECMMRIMKDERHQSIQILLASEVESRLFSKWSMRCISTSEMDEKIRVRYWINETFNPAQMSQAAIEDLCLALAEAPKED